MSSPSSQLCRPRTGATSSTPPRLLTLLLTLLVATTSPRPAHAAEALQSETTRASKAHPRVILAPRSTPTGTLRIQFRAGAFDDGYRPGLTRLTQQAIVAANQREPYERLAVDLFGAAATLEIDTSVREATFVLTAPRRDFPALARRVAAMVLAPNLVEAKLEGAKSRTVQDSGGATIGMLTSVLARTLFTEAWANDPDGDKEAIRALGFEDLTLHLRGPLSPANATVIVTGPFDPREMRSFLSRFSGGKESARERPKGDLAGNHHQRSRLELHMLAIPAKVDSPRAVAAAQLLAAVLDERILRQFRRMGIAYAASAAPVHREWLDAIIVALPISQSSDVPVAGHLAHELAEVRAGKFLGDELERNRANLLARFDALDRDSAALADALAMGGGDLEWVGPKVAAEVRAMTAEALLGTVEPWLDPAASIHVQLSPRSTASQARDGKR